MKKMLSLATGTPQIATWRVVVLLFLACSGVMVFAQEGASQTNTTNATTTNTTTDVPTLAPTFLNANNTNPSSTNLPTGILTDTPTASPLPINNNPPGSFTLFEILQQKNLVLADLAESVGLQNVLNDPTANLTLFAPTNKAFLEDLHPDILQYLQTPEYAPILRAYLLGHVVTTGRFPTDALGRLDEPQELTFGNGAVRQITMISDTDIFVDSVPLIETDIDAENGVMHTVDRLLNIMDFAQAMETFYPALLSALRITELLDQMNGTTFFAPNLFALTRLSATSPELADVILTDPTFELHLADLLLAHIHPQIMNFSSSSDLLDGQILTMANGDNFTIARFGAVNSSFSLSPALNNNNNGTATIVASDYLTLQTVLNAIDAFLSPSFLEKTIVDVAREYASTMASLIVAAELETQLIETFNLTLFVPTNEAFETVNGYSISFLQTEEGIPSLQLILSYHFVQGVLPSTSILTNTSLPTYYLDGATVVGLSKIGDDIFVNGYARVVQADALANTGLAHIIDRVLSLPPAPVPPNTPEPPAPPPSPTHAPVASDAAAACGVRLAVFVLLGSSVITIAKPL